MKTISAPLSFDAMKRLDLDECLPGDLDELQLSDEDYAQLLKSGVIEKINSSLDILIDEYEDENIQGETELTKLIDILTEAYKQTNFEPLEKLIKLNRSALQNKTGVFFYF